MPVTFLIDGHHRLLYFFTLCNLGCSQLGFLVSLAMEVVVAAAKVLKMGENGRKIRAEEGSEKIRWVREKIENGFIYGGQTAAVLTVAIYTIFTKKIK